MSNGHLHENRKVYTDPLLGWNLRGIFPGTFVALGDSSSKKGIRLDLLNDGYM